MSRIEDLIKDKCSNGVEFLPIREVCNFVQGFAFKNDTFLSEGWGLIRTTNIQNGKISETGMVFIDLKDYKVDLSKYTVEKDTIVIGMSGTIKIAMNRNDKKYLLNQRVGKFLPFSSIINNNYLFHILQNSISDFYKLVSGSSVKNLSSREIENYLIPVPPMEIQENIANFLDKFIKIDTELEAELESRKKQYKFWLNKIFCHIDKKYTKVKFSDISSIQRGGNFQKTNMINQGYPCIHYGQIYTKYSLFTNNTYSYLNKTIYDKQKKAKKNDVIMAITSENMEDVCKTVVWLGNSDVAVSGHTAIISSKQNGKYLAYYFQSIIFQNIKYKYARGVKVVEFQPNKLMDIEIALPPIEIQDQVVNILDKFDKLVNDISEGIPAELELRKKQYEYYRNKLLNFDKVIIHE